MKVLFFFLALSASASVLDDLEKTRIESPATPVFAVHCEKSAPPPADTPVRATASTTALPFKLEQAGYYLKDVLALLSMTESGKESVARFQKRTESGDLKTEQMTNEGQRRCPKGALACYVPSTKTLYVDKSGELGALAPVLFHEILHANDDELAESQTFAETVRDAAKGKTTAEIAELGRLNAILYETTQVAFFKTERRAYDGAFRVQRELVALFPDYYRQAGPRLGLSIPGNPSDDFIIRVYALNRPLIEKFLRGQCQIASLLSQ